MDKSNQKDSICAFDYPNNVAPKPYNQIYYGNQYVPHPTNMEAKRVDSAKILGEVLEGK